MMNIKPQMTLLKAQASYRGDPTTIFHQLCGARPATLLLESAEINSKQNLQSLLVIDSALRITALGHTVSVQALSANGAALLPLLDEALPPEVRNQARPNGRELSFPAIDAVQDEDARLRSLSVFDALRTLLTLVDSPADEREAVMLGGLFAYDLVAGFEDLPALRRISAARTSASIWRKPCWCWITNAVRPVCRPASSVSRRVKRSVCSNASNSCRPNCNKPRSRSRTKRWRTCS
ncbi:hypothetical protein M8494_08525 [Serratia ureilytica]